MHVCMECYEVYDDLYGRHFEYCPKVGCGGDRVVEIDELIIPAIIALNKKEYITEFCCSGHVYGTGTGGYIKFAAGIAVDSAPSGWKIEKGLNGEFIIRYTIESDNDSDRYIEILDSMESLMLWVSQLGNCEDGEYTAQEVADRLQLINVEVEKNRKYGMTKRVKMLDDDPYGMYKAGDIVELLPTDLAVLIDEEVYDIYKTSNDGEVAGWLRTGDFECIQIYHEEIAKWLND